MSEYSDSRLVTFSCPAYADITMFGDVAVRLLELVGYSGTVPGDLLADGDRVTFLFERAQFLDLALQVGDRFLEVKVAAHQVPRESEWWHPQAPDRRKAAAN